MIQDPPHPLKEEVAAQPASDPGLNGKETYGLSPPPAPSWSSSRSRRGCCGGKGQSSPVLARRGGTPFGMSPEVHNTSSWQVSIVRGFSPDGVPFCPPDHIPSFLVPRWGRGLQGPPPWICCPMPQCCRAAMPSRPLRGMVWILRFPFTPPTPGVCPGTTQCMHIVRVQDPSRAPTTTQPG